MTLATKGDLTETVKTLLDAYNIDAKAQDHAFRVHLMLAIHSGNLDMARTIIQATIMDVEKPHLDMPSALYHATSIDRTAPNKQQISNFLHEYARHRAAYLRRQQ